MKEQDRLEQGIEQLEARLKIINSSILFYKLKVDGYEKQKIDTLVKIATKNARLDGLKKQVVQGVSVG